MTVPFALTAQSSPEKQRGLYVGVLNIFVVLAEGCMSACGPIFVASFGSVDAILASLAAGSVGAFVAAALTLCFISNRTALSDALDASGSIRELDMIVMSES